MEKILLIDDSRIILEGLIRRVKKNNKFEPIIAKNFAEAKEQIEHHTFFAAIVDLELPDCKTADAVRLTLAYHIPTIVLTGLLNDDLRELLTKKPIIDYILKNSLDDIDSAVTLAENLLIFKGQRALIVDDSVVYRTAIDRMLNVLLLDAVTVENPKEALQLLQYDNDFSLVIIDYYMPDMNGIDLLREMRKSSFRYPPVFFGISQAEEASIRIHFLKYGAEDVFLKPFIKEEFNLKVMRALMSRYHKEEIKRHNILIAEKNQQLQELNHVLEEKVIDEVGKRIEQERMLVQQSKMAAMGEMIGAIAHQWRQPLNALSVIIQDIEDSYTYNEINQDYITQIVQQSMHNIHFMSKTIDDFRNFFKTDKKKVPFDVIAAIHNVLEIIKV